MAGGQTIGRDYWLSPSLYLYTIGLNNLQSYSLQSNNLQSPTIGKAITYSQKTYS